MKSKLGKDLYDTTSAYQFITGKLDPPKKKRRHKKRKFSPPKVDSNYLKHIHSTQWRLFRMSIIATRGNRCERCGWQRGRLDLHHKHYLTFGNEQPEDVELLCRRCHEAHHSR